MMRNRHLVARGGVSPDFMASRTMAVEYESEAMKATDDFTAFESGEASHSRALADPYGHQQVQWAFTKLGERRRERIAVFNAGLDDLARQPLSDLDSFHEAAPLGDQAGNVRTGGDVPTFVQSLDVQPKGCFVHLHPVALASTILAAFGVH